jgi:hypothetical protein
MINRIVVFLFLIISEQSFSQYKAQQAIQSFDQDFPQEKVYLQFNKNSFAAGDDLRFKAFVFDGYGQSKLSTTLFVEFYDNNKKLIDKKLIPLYNSEGDGNFTLADDLKENMYYIRAYTAWMSNFNEDFQFIRPIAVYNPNSPEKLIKNNNADWTASVYPESGTLVDGINTKVAVRLHSKGKTPTDWNGYIIDKENPNVHLAEFKSFDQNVGSFSITPKKNRQYQLIVTGDKGKKQAIDLPHVAESGINLQVASNHDKIEYQIKSSNIKDDSGYYKIIATIGSRFVYKARIKKNSNREVFSIPTDQLINGVMQLTLFDEQENVVAQRLCFIRSQKLNISQPSLQSITLDTKPKALNSFEIKDNANVPDYNITIYDDIIENFEENILSAFWLTGDFTDKIDTPAQYFTNNRNADALDALLISEQWKRFDWKDLIAGKRPLIKNKPESYLSYNIRITSNGVPIKNTPVNIMLNGDKAGSKLLSVPTDNNGELILKNMAFYEPQKIYYQVKADNLDAIVIPKLSFISLKKELPQNDFILTKRLPNEPLTADAEQAITNSRFQKKMNEKITDIQEVKLTAKKQSPTDKLNDELSSPLFQSASETIFDFVNDKTLGNGSPDILLWLEGRVAGLQIQRDGGDIEAVIRNKKVDIYLDEVKTDLEIIRGFNISNVAMIKVVRDDFFGGFGNSNGAILIYTKNGNSTSEEISKSMTGLKFFAINGYNKPEAYKNIDYNNVSFKNTSNDDRRLLYWNSKSNVSSGQSEKVEFYNNDSAKRFRVIIIGFDNENQLPVFYDDKLP